MIFNQAKSSFRKIAFLRFPRGWSYRAHVHRQRLNELFLVTRGCLSTRTAAGTFDAKAGDMILNPAGISHAPRSTGTQDLEMYQLDWSGPMRTAPPFQYVRHDSQGRIRHQLTWLLDLIPEIRPSDRRTIGVLFRSVLCEYARLCDAPEDDMVVTVKRYMRRNLSRPIRLDDLAAEVRLNRYYFIRRFRQATGEPPMKMLRRFRIEAARELIGRSSLSLKEIAFETGFSDEVHFAHAFKDTVGRPPGSLRATKKR